MSIQLVQLTDCFPVNLQGFQRIHIFNQQNTGSDKIALEYVILPQGAESTPHAHLNTHTVVFTLQGSVRIYFGDKLENQVVVPTLGCVYIPPNEIHFVVNESEVDMIAIVARSPAINKIEEYKDLTSLIQF